MNTFIQHRGKVILSISTGIMLFAVICNTSPASAVESLCARVRMQINQETTLERQAFDACLKINNPMENMSLEQVGVDVYFADEEGNSVTASSNPNDQSASFFIMVDVLDKIDTISGSGVVAPQTSAEIHWLIIPAPGAGSDLPSGKIYYVGAQIHYSIDGETNSVDVTPDTIIVRPMPKLQLDYFIPTDVYGDDAFTAMIEPSIPFNLGLRVKNAGYGPANNMQIDSSQVKIVENSHGLLVGFQITGTRVNDAPAALSLNADLGTISPGKTAVARWIMESTLSGRFIEFDAYYTHADELGGQMTSLIDSLSTHFLLHDVIVDLPGRDSIRDFLAKDGDVIRVYESDAIDTIVQDQSDVSTMTGPSGSTLSRTYTISVPVTSGPLYVKKAIDNATHRKVVSVVRDDGKILPLDNAWLYMYRGSGDLPWEHYLCLFDVNGGGTYTIVVGDVSGTLSPPVLGAIPNPVLGKVGEPIEFLVQASDPNGRVQSMDATPLPANAAYHSIVNGALGESTFSWTPQSGQEGIYHVDFSVSDGLLSDTRDITFLIGDENQDTNRSLRLERFIVSRDPSVVGSGTGVFTYVDGTPAPTGLRVQCLVAPINQLQIQPWLQYNSPLYPPPSTNGMERAIVTGETAAGYFIPTPCREYEADTVRIGIDDAVTRSYDTGMPGFVSAYIHATNDAYCGWLRTFSATAITNAAYYGDTCATNTELKTPDQVNCNWTPRNPCMSLVNPAYAIPFIVPPVGGGGVTGRVAAVEGGSANTLAAEQLQIEYRYAGDVDWVVLTTNLTATGEFSAFIAAPTYPTNVQVRARVMDIYTPRPGFPASRTYDVEIIPEPWSALYGLFMLLWIQLRRIHHSRK